MEWIACNRKKFIEKISKIKINLKNAKKFHLESHDIQRHYFGKDVLTILDSLYNFFDKRNNKYFLKLKKIFAKNKKRSFKSNF